MTQETTNRLDMSQPLSLADIKARNPLVTSTSRWNDSSWYFDGLISGQTRSQQAIHWTVACPNRLLNEAKMLAAILFFKGGDESQLAPATSINFSIGIRHLLRFMTNYSYSAFEQLDADAFALFEKTLSVRLSDPDWWRSEMADETWSEEQSEIDLSALEADADFVDEHVPISEGAELATDIEAGDELTAASAYVRLRIWRELFRHSAAMKAAGARVIPANPFADRSLWKVTEDVSSVASVLIPPLPDKVAIKIMGRAQVLMGIPADDVLSLQQLYIEAKGAVSGNTTPYQRDRIRAALQDFEFSKIDGQPWRGPIVTTDNDGSGMRELKTLIELIRDAAVLTIYGGTGVRSSEFCSLKATPAPPAATVVDDASAHPIPSVQDLPSCVSIGTSKTGLNDHFFMHGRVFKHRRGGKDVKWLIGARPKGDVTEPPTLRALRVLDQLYAPWRTLARDRETMSSLTLTFSAGMIPASSAGIGPITATALRPSLRRFIATQCGLDELAADAEFDRKLLPYVQSNGACIRPHQWRKTFALYMMKVDDRMLPALTRHFKHLTIAVTENHYMPQDPSMLAAFDSVHAQEAARWFYEQRHGAGGSFGRLDDIMAAHREEWEKLVADLPFDEAVPAVQRFCLERDIRIFNAEHGRCVLAANPDKARCHEIAGTGSWRNTTPNHLTRTPGLCAGCSNFSVSAEHASFWRRRFVDNQSSWLRSDRSAQFRVVQKRAQQAEMVLAALGVPKPVILAEAPSDRARRRGAKAPIGARTKGKEVVNG